MPEQRLTLRGGVDVELTPADNRGGWSSADKVRFREGRVEKLRGFQNIANQQHLQGFCRSLHWWEDLSSVARIAAGTNSNLELWVSGVPGAGLPPVGTGVIVDITPVGLAPGKTSSAGVPFSLRIWSLDNFGQNLLAVPSGGAVYEWIPPALTPATIVSTAPMFSQGGFMTMPEQIFMLFGSSPDGGSMDPLLVRWCDQSDYTVWDPTTTNFAGSFRLSRGSRIIGGVQTPLGVFLWTDLDVWTASFEGQPLVFGFFQLSSNCGLIGQKAVVVVGNVPYWLSDHGPFTMGASGAQQIPCPVWDYLFLDLDEANADKCVCSLNYHFNHIKYRFPSKSGGTGEIDSYIGYNFIDNSWDTGRETFIATTDQVRPGDPVEVDLTGKMVQTDSTLDADGAPLVCFAESGFQDIQDGSQIMLVSRFMPDFVWEGNGPNGQGPQADITLYFRRFPDDPPTAVGPFTITPQTEYVTLAIPHPTEPGIIIRPRGREYAVRIDWNAIDSWSRWGAPRILVAPDGRW
jgi:hypothetical protein